MKKISLFLIAIFCLASCGFVTGIQSYENYNFANSNISPVDFSAIYVQGVNQSFKLQSDDSWSLLQGEFEYKVKQSNVDTLISELLVILNNDSIIVGDLKENEELKNYNLLSRDLSLTILLNNFKKIDLSFGAFDGTTMNRYLLVNGIKVYRVREELYRKILSILSSLQITNPIFYNTDLESFNNLQIVANEICASCRSYEIDYQKEVINGLYRVDKSRFIEYFKRLTELTTFFNKKGMPFDDQDDENYQYTLIYKNKFGEEELRFYNQQSGTLGLYPVYSSQLNMTFYFRNRVIKKIESFADEVRSKKISLSDYVASMSGVENVSKDLLSKEFSVIDFTPYDDSRCNDKEYMNSLLVEGLRFDLVRVNNQNSTILEFCFKVTKIDDDQNIDQVSFYLDEHNRTVLDKIFNFLSW